MRHFISIFIVSLIGFFLILNSPSYGQTPLIPEPTECQWGDGQIKLISVDILENSEYQDELEFLHEFLDNMSIECEGGRGVKIRIKNKKVKNPYGIDGAYELIVDEEILIKSPSPRGVFYAIQTLKQLITIGENGSILMQKCEIRDWPAFEVRGFMHDVGRNFQSMELLKEQIDVLAFYKYSVFHFHVTDNHGWRLESKLYPQLQDSAATSRKPGKFYSQEEFVELFEYCEARHITLIPELDIPGHTQAFRKALGISTMNTPAVQTIICNLVDELCSLIPADRMPYIHLGTDEVWRKEEKVDPDFLVPIIRRVSDNNRKYISWWHGMKVPGDSTSIKQAWAQSEALEGHPLIDSRSNYINHLDPLAGMYRLFYQQPCRVPHGDEIYLGGILCCWPDNRVVDERNILRQNPVYPSMVFYSNSIWRGKAKSYGMDYWAKIPDKGTQECTEFEEFEEKVLIHKELYFSDKEFPYVRHTNIPWRIIGPFDFKDDVRRSFPVEDEIRDEYVVDGKTYKWREKAIYGGTVHLKHFFGFPGYVNVEEGTVYATTNIWSPVDQEVGFWISFHNWSRSGGRKGGPAPEQGEWTKDQPKIWVNGEEIAPPIWDNPGFEVRTLEIPFTNEDYCFREPSYIHLKSGWNKILLKVPHTKSSWKWMFTCIPVVSNGQNMSQMEGLRYRIAN